jgi:hypothetical protein
MSKRTTPPALANKTVLEVQPEIHERVKSAASGSGHSVKRFAGLMLDYALSKFESGDIELKQPEVVDSSAKA